MRPQRFRIQAVDFEDIVHADKWFAVFVVQFFERASRCVFGDYVYPCHSDVE